MLALVTTILAAAALRESYPVTMPLTVSILLIAAVWPLKLWFDRLMPKASYIRTSLILLAFSRFSLLHFIFRPHRSFTPSATTGDSSNRCIRQSFAGSNDWDLKELSSTTAPG